LPITDLADRTHRRLLVAVGVIVAVTLTGMVLLWPSSEALPDVPARDDALIDGTVSDVEIYQGEPDEFLGTDGERARIEVDVHTGPDARSTVEIDTATEGYPDIDVGDRVKLSVSEIDGVREHYIVDFERSGALAWLFALFVGAVLLVSGWRGVRSLIGLALSLVVVIQFIVPGILAGEPPFLVALVGAVAVMLISLYVAHGVNEMTTAAVVGTSLALGVTIGLGALFIDLGSLTGYSSEEANLARFAVAGLDLKGLILAGLTIAALGVLDDVTVSQASTVFALHDTDRRLTWRQLVGRAMVVGRDHIASTVNTLFLAYAGASLALLVVFSTGGLPVGEVVNSEIMAGEIIKTVVGSLGIITAVPFTTALAATLAVRRPFDAPPVRGAHLHDHEPPAGAAATTVATVDDADWEDDETLSESERAHRAWVRYLRSEGTDGDEPPASPVDGHQDTPPEGPRT
jgi:uncharacterized membrane protein